MSIVSTSWFCFCLAFTFLGLFHAVDSQDTRVRYDNPRANLSSVWVNMDKLDSPRVSANYSNTLAVRPLLIYSRSPGTRYACGFYRNGTGYLFGVFMVKVNSIAELSSPTSLPQIVWSANRNRLVGENATLELTGEGNLILRDEHKAEVWSTNTSARGVVAMEMQGSGNLALLDGGNESVWQSFDHPTDALVLRQPLRSGMRLTSSASWENSSEGAYWLEMKNNGIFLSARGSPPQPYWSKLAEKNASGDITPFMLFANSTIFIFVTKASADSYAGSPKSVSSVSDGFVYLPATSQAKYLKLDPDGSIRRYDGSLGWRSSYNVLGASGRGTTPVGECGMPSTCRSYAVCNGGQCSCLQAKSDAPPSDSFSEFVPGRADLGCSPSAPLVCNNTRPGDGQHLLEVSPSLDYPSLDFLSELGFGIEMSSMDGCKQVCLANCSCKIAFYRNATASGGTCYALDEVYTLKSPALSRSTNISTSAFIRMQNVQLPSARRSFWSKKGRILLGVLLPLVTVLVIVISAFAYRKRLILRRKEELMLDSMAAGLPRRFSHRELCIATDNFSNKLGQGGFGSVFLGILQDETKVAVKRLESAKQGQKEFRTEVSIIGSIHHLNLVQLRGFCAERDHRLLVYEYMPNGSLDRWLFANPENEEEHGSEHFLDWEVRFRVALSTARGLAYLHEECRERIIHLDIKPQNILLDDSFSAKVCDFGMSKLMDRKESEVFTLMRGTPGYLAPEWLQSSITEKADVYSFGIVLLEIVSGQKCLDNSRVDSGKRYFPSWAIHKAGHGRTVDIIDKRLQENMQSVVEQAEMLIHVALWCIQEDPARRPSMGTVVQMLEGLVDVPEPPLHHLNDEYDAAEEQDSQPLVGRNLVKNPSLAEKSFHELSLCHLYGPPALIPDMRSS